MKTVRRFRTASAFAALTMASLLSPLADAGVVPPHFTAIDVPAASAGEPVTVRLTSLCQLTSLSSVRTEGNTVRLIIPVVPGVVCDGVLRTYSFPIGAFAVGSYVVDVVWCFDECEIARSEVSTSFVVLARPIPALSTFGTTLTILAMIALGARFRATVSAGHDD